MFLIIIIISYDSFMANFIVEKSFYFFGNYLIFKVNRYAFYKKGIFNVDNMTITFDLM